MYVQAFFALAALSNRISTWTKVDVLRIKNIGWYIREYYSNTDIIFEEFVSNTQAPVAHHFNVHTYCNRSWCWAKDLDDIEDQTAQNTLQREDDNDSDYTNMPPLSTHNSNDYCNVDCENEDDMPPL